MTENSLTPIGAIIASLSLREGSDKSTIEQFKAISGTTDNLFSKLLFSQTDKEVPHAR